MSQIQPGSGYTFSASSSGVTLNIDKPFIQYDSIDEKQDTSLELLSIYPFKIVKRVPENEGDWLELIDYLAFSALEQTPYVIIPDTGPQFMVLQGTINGNVCSLGWTACEDGSPTQYIYLQTYPEVDQQIIVSEEVLEGNDDEDYVLIGAVDYTSKTQNIMNSLVMERFKCGTNDAQYWYSKI
jgi:hypothetical protein